MLKQLTRLKAATQKLSALLLGFLLIPSAYSGTGYAEVKKHVCDNCFSASALPFPRPQQGLVLFADSLHATHKNWYVLDFSSRQITLFITTVVGGSSKPHISHQRQRELSASDFNQLRQLANSIWAKEQRIASVPATDVRWTLYLLDDQHIRQEGGPGLAGGEAASLFSIVSDLLKKPDDPWKKP